MQQVLDALKRAYGGPSALDEPRPLEQVILLVLSRGTDIRRAQNSMRQLQSAYVDWNEVRVTSAYELRKHLRGLGENGSGDKADQLKDLLNAIYNRFNKLNLDFLLAESADPEAIRKRERFHGWLQEKSPALAPVMSLYGSPKDEVVVTAALPRLLQRLGLVNGKSPGIGATREALQKQVAECDLVSAHWCFYHVLEERCHGRSPDCPACAVHKLCPNGQAEIKARKTAESKAVPVRVRAGK